MNAAVNQKQGIESFLSGKLAQVDVRKIETELSRLWTQAAGSSQEEDHPQVIRACSSNLILYSDRDDAETTDANMLDEIVLSHPSRAILAICREADSQRLEAWVSARCHLASPGGGTKQICSEQITVLAEGPHLQNELVSVIESLILGDLPVFLWWTSSDLSGDKLGSFLACSRRLIVDSARAPYSFKFLRELSSIADTTEGCISVSDLNWRRLLGIRAAIAEEFERAPFSIQDLNKITTVKVGSCSQEFQSDDCSLQALLFVGWLASRLAWEPVSIEKKKDKTSSARFEKSGQSINVELYSQEMRHVASGSIFEIEIESAGAKKLRVSRDPAGEAGTLLVTVSENGKRLREVIADDSDMDRVHLLGYELEELSADKVFLQSLASAADLIQLLEAE